MQRRGSGLKKILKEYESMPEDMKDNKVEQAE
jgi:hypothetical protein